MKIVYFLPDIKNQFWKEVALGIEQSLPTPGDSLELVSCSHDAARQVAQLKAYASHAPDAVVVSPVDESGIVPVCRLVLDSGKPLISIDSNMTSQAIASVISGNMRGGMLAASHIADRAGRGARVVHIKAEEHLNNVKMRSASFVAEARRRGLRIQGSLQANSSMELARSKMAEFLAQPTVFEAVFAENDRMAIGAIGAIESAKLPFSPIVVGYDGTAEAKALIRSKKMDATILQNAPVLGQKAMELLVGLLQGRPVGEVVTVLPSLLTSEALA